MRIIFVRHGQNKNDNLTRLGKKQAKILVNDLIYEGISKIYSSPQNRAVSTATIIAKKLKINNVTIDQRLAEREAMNDKMTATEIEEFKENYLNPIFSRKNPEGLKQYIKRIFEFLDETIKANENEKSILIVGHSSMSYVLGAYFYGFKDDENLIWTRVGNCSKICYEVQQKK